MPTTAERLAALEADNVALRAELAQLRGEHPAEPAPVAPAPSTYRDPVASVTKVPMRYLVMPNDGELRALYGIAGQAHPALMRTASRFEHSDAPFDEFRAAFLAVGLLGRTPKLDASRAVSWWVDYSRYDADGATGDSFGTHAFVLAALAHGDVPYRAWTASSSVEFGLTYSGVGTPAGAAWRGVLAAGRVPAPIAQGREPFDVRGRVERFGVGVP